MGKLSVGAVIKEVIDTFHAIRKSWVAYMFLAPTMLCMGVLVLYPMGRGLYIAFTDMDQYNMGNAFQSATYSFTGLENLKTVLFDEDTELWSVLRQTLIWTFVNVFFHFTIGLALALLMNRKFAGRATFRMLLMVPWAVPAYIVAFAWRWMFNNDYGFFNQMLKLLDLPTISWTAHPGWAMFAAIATNVWLGFPFMMMTLLGGLQSIPNNVYEAAEIDGASKWKQLIHITLPLLKPVSFTAILLGTIWTFNMFPIIYLVTGGGPYGKTEILATFAYREAFERWNLGLASAYGLVIFVILIGFSSVYKRVAKLDT